MAYELYEDGTKIGKYKIIKRIGEGAFSFVYKACDIEKDKTVALKILTKTSGIKRTATEISYLMELKKIYAESVINILNVFRRHEEIIIVFPYFENIEFREFLDSCSITNIKFYIYNLLKGLRDVHRLKIIHRDIKPNNFIFCPEKNRGYLIDFGLAQRIEYGEKRAPQRCVKFFSAIYNMENQSSIPGYDPNDKRPALNAHRAGTRGYRAPEVLFKVRNQTEKIDIWSVGVILLICMTRQYPFFYSQDDIDALVEIACIYGEKEMKYIANKYKRVWKSNIDTIPENRISFVELIEKTEASTHYSKNDIYLAADLLDKLMDLNCDKRITAVDALTHPFFFSII